MGAILSKMVWTVISWVVIAAVAIFAYSSFFAGNKPPPPPPAKVLEAIKIVNKHIFVEHYNAVDIDHTYAPSDWLKGLIYRKFVVLLRGRVPAGFDLQQLDLEKIQVFPDQNKVIMHLPAPVAFEVYLDLANSRILSFDDWCLFCPEPLTKFKDVVSEHGEKALIELALQNGILDQAALEGKAYYELFLRSLGFQDVTVVVTGYGL